MRAVANHLDGDAPARFGGIQSILYDMSDDPFDPVGVAFGDHFSGKFDVGDIDFMPLPALGGVDATNDIPKIDPTRAVDRRCAFT